MKSRLPRERPPVLANRRYNEHADRLRGLGMAETFRYIHRTNLWGSPESRSGSGSEDAATVRLRREIPALLRRLGAETLLDLPCGDFGWLCRADLSGIEYTGGDIVAEIAETNRERHGGPGRRFLELDLASSALPKADVVLCRDCLVHFCHADIFRAFANLRRSGSVYLLTTTFVELGENRDIATGDWRPLNLQKPPFNLPPPRGTIIEGCFEEDGAYADKSLCLWEIAALPERPQRKDESPGGNRGFRGAQSE